MADNDVYREQELARLAEIERCARGLVRTAHPTDVGVKEVVRAWWDALRLALDV
jgi:hypothetical protein